MSSLWMRSDPGIYDDVTSPQEANSVPQSSRSDSKLEGGNLEKPSAIGLKDLPALFTGLRLAPVAPHEHIVSKNGFCEGVLSHEFFLEWVNGSDRVKAAKVTSIAWFRSNRNVLHHQFIIATVAYAAGDDMPETQYDVKIERMGRMVGPGGRAKQTVTIQQAAPLAENLTNDANELVMALVDKHNSLRAGTLASQSLFPSYFDEQWRGSQATLGLLARYSSIVVDGAPAYHLSSTNCYFYARLIMQIMIERHLSFEYIVSPSLLGGDISVASAASASTTQDVMFPPILISTPMTTMPSQYMTSPNLRNYAPGIVPSTVSSRSVAMFPRTHHRSQRRNAASSNDSSLNILPRFPAGYAIGNVATSGLGSPYRPGLQAPQNITSHPSIHPWSSVGEEGPAIVPLSSPYGAPPPSVSIHYNPLDHGEISLNSTHRVQGHNMHPPAVNIASTPYVIPSNGMHPVASRILGEPPRGFPTSAEVFQPTPFAPMSYIYTGGRPLPTPRRRSTEYSNRLVIPPPVEVSSQLPAAYLRPYVYTSVPDSRNHPVEESFYIQTQTQTQPPPLHGIVQEMTPTSTRSRLSQTRYPQFSNPEFAATPVVMPNLPQSHPIHVQSPYLVSIPAQEMSQRSSRSSRLGHIQPFRVSSGTVNIVTSSPRSQLTDELARQEANEGVLFGSYVVVIVRFATLASAAILLSGMLLSIILLITIWGNTASASIVGFVIGPAVAVIFFASAIALRFIPRITQNMQNNLGRLQSNIMSQILSDHLLQDAINPHRPYFYRPLAGRKGYSEIVQKFSLELIHALRSHDVGAVGRLFHDTGHLRIPLAAGSQLISVAKNDLQTVVGPSSILQVLSEAQYQPENAILRGSAVFVQGFFDFNIPGFHGSCCVWLSPNKHDIYLAQIISIRFEPSTFLARSLSTYNQTNSLYSVVIVGAGKSGVLMGKALRSLGVDVLIIEKASRAGNSWRTRYHEEFIRYPKAALHFPSLELPHDWSDRITPIMMADWIEGYASIMGIEVWTQSEISPSSTRFDDESGLWDLEVSQRGSAVRNVQCRHLIQATGECGGEPVQPIVEGSDDFGGLVIHSSQFCDSILESCLKKRVTVIGAGNSGHDIAKRFAQRDVNVTLIQRSPMRVISHATSLKRTYFDENPFLVDRAFLHYPPEFLSRSSDSLLTSNDPASPDNQLRSSLATIDLKVNESPFSPYRTIKGLHVDVGCSELLLSHAIKVVSKCEPKSFEPGRLCLDNGESIETDAVIFATGFESMDETCRRILGDKLADQIGPAWSSDGDPVGVCGQTGHPNFWFIGGHMLLVRAYAQDIARKVAITIPSLRPVSHDDSDDSKSSIYLSLAPESTSEAASMAGEPNE